MGNVFACPITLSDELFTITDNAMRPPRRGEGGQLTCALCLEREEHTYSVLVMNLYDALSHRKSSGHPLLRRGQHC